MPEVTREQVQEAMALVDELLTDEPDDSPLYKLWDLRAYIDELVGVLSELVRAADYHSTVKTHQLNAAISNADKSRAKWRDTEVQG